MIKILLAPGFKTRPTGLKFRLNVHHPELAPFAFLVRSHGPKKCDAMPGN